MKNLKDILVEGFYKNVGASIDVLIDEWMSEYCHIDEEDLEGNRINKYKINDKYEIEPLSEIKIRINKFHPTTEVPNYIKFVNAEKYDFNIMSCNCINLDFLPEVCKGLNLCIDGIKNLNTLSTKKCNSLYLAPLSLFSKSTLNSTKGLPECKTLIMRGGNFTKLEDISPNLEVFRSIDLRQLCDISELKKCKNLKELTLEDSAITDISFLAGDMNRVSVEGCKKLSSIASNLRYVKDFNCSRTLITSLQGAPKKCDIFTCEDCPNLASLEGIPVSKSIRSKGCPAAGRDGKSFNNSDKYNAILNSRVSGVPNPLKAPVKKMLTLKDKLKRSLSI